MSAETSETSITPPRWPTSSAARCIGVIASRLRKPVSTSRASDAPALMQANSAHCMNGTAIAKSR